MGMFYDQGNLPTSSSSQGGVNPNNPVTLKAGIGQISTGDVVFSAADGGAYALKVTDSAAAANQGAALFASASIGGVINDSLGHRQAIAQSAIDKTLYTCDEKYVYRVSPGGKVLATTALTGSYATGAGSYPMRVVVLSNGNVAVVGVTGATQLQYSVYDSQLLTVVKATTAIGTIAPTGDGAFDALALSGGGFAVVAHYNTLIYLAIYDNTGAAVLPPTNEGTAAGSVSSARLAQAANGNILACVTQSTGGYMYYGTFSETGTVIAAMAAVATNTNTPGVDCNTAGNTFAILYGNISSGLGSIVVNATTGAQIGATYTGYTTNGGIANEQGFRLVSDGSRYWVGFIGGTVTPASVNLTLYSITTAGVVAAQGTFDVVSGTSPGAGLRMDMTLRNGLVVGTLFLGGSTTTSCPSVALQSSDNTATMALNQIGGQFYLGGDNTLFGGPIRPSVLLLDDFVYFSFNAASSGLEVAACKAIDTAIEGVALSAVAAGNRGTTVQVVSGPGVYSANTISGSAGKAFDHTGTNIAGCKGTVFAGGLKITQ